MKDKRHLQSFNEHGENLNISDVMNSKSIKSAQIMSDQEIDNDIKKQRYNIQNFKDIFDKIDEISELKFTNENEKVGAIKSLRILKNYILNRDID